MAKGNPVEIIPLGVKISDGATNTHKCMSPKPPNKSVQHPRNDDGVVRGGYK
jgi:hypothetical protein